jgi:solute carrier family 25 carnitine/acylcarnitine transporter 20/29
MSKHSLIELTYLSFGKLAVGWAITDAILLGSLHNYRLLLAKHTPLIRPSHPRDPPGTSAKLSLPGHAVRRFLSFVLNIRSHPLTSSQLAGTLAGLTVAVAATPIELVKVQLQMQLVPTSSLLSTSSSSSIPAATTTKYISPLGFAKQIYTEKGITGFWHGVRATMAQRAWFGVMFGSYDVMLRYARTEVKKKDGTYGPRIKEGTANFLAGGLSSSESHLNVHTSCIS